LPHLMSSIKSGRYALACCWLLDALRSSMGSRRSSQFRPQ
jgi:hypothetical protein